MYKNKHFTLEERVFSHKLENGLDVFILPKKGYHKTFATLVTKYGSADNGLYVNQNNEPLLYPSGIAHFLEHSVFESKEGNVFQDFSTNGATVNAYTNFSRTGYTMSATSKIKQNIQMLLDFVQEPYFTDERIQDEKLIIEQEINMYQDNIDWQAKFKLLQNMYSIYPVREDIAGTVSSIQSISKSDLYSCYDHFYHPSNMAMFITGDVNAKELLPFIQSNQREKRFQKWDEPIRMGINDRTINMKSDILFRNLPKPRVMIGHKQLEFFRSGYERVKYELALNVLLELMFGSSSKAFEKMSKQNILDDSFLLEVTSENGFGFTMIGSDTDRPEEFVEIVNETIEEFKSKEFNKADVQTIVRREFGVFLRALNSPAYTANQFIRYHFNEMNFFEVSSALEGLTIIDLEEAMKHFSESSKSELIIKNI